MSDAKTQTDVPLAREFRTQGCYLGRVPKGADLVGYLEEFVREKGVRAGVLGAVGVVQRARLAFFDAETRRYVVTEISGHREIASSSGNVSLRDGRPVVHLHAVLSDDGGRTSGGHVLDGTQAFYVEFWVLALEGQPFERGPDPATGVTGWVK